MADDGTLLKNTLFNVLARGIASGVPLLVSMYASRKIGVDAFGTAQYILWLIATVWMFLNFGLPITLVRFIALRLGDRKKNAAHAMIAWSFSICLVLCSLGVVVFAFAFHAASTLWLETFLLFVVMSFSSVLQSVNEGLMRFKHLFHVSLLSGCVMLACFFPVIRSYSLEGYIAVLIGGAIVSVVFMTAGLRGFSFLPRGKAAEIFGTDVRTFAFYSWLAAIISSFTWQSMELFFIKTYLTSADVAYFSIALLLASYVTQPIALLSSALLPYFSREVGGLDNRSAQGTYFFLTKLLAWLTFFACFFTAANSSFILTFIYGQAYGPAKDVAAIVLSGSSFGTIAAVGSALLYAHGKSKFIAIFGSLGAMIAIFAGVLVIPTYGIIGAGISKVAIQMSMVIIGTFYIVKYLQFRFPFGGYVKSFFLSFLICLGLHLLFPAETVFQLFINACITLLCYIIGTLALSIFDMQEINALKLRVAEFFLGNPNETK